MYGFVFIALFAFFVLAKNMFSSNLILDNAKSSSSAIWLFPVISILHISKISDLARNTSIPIYVSIISKWG